MKFRLYQMAAAFKSKVKSRRNNVAVIDTNKLYQVIAPNVARATEVLQYKYGTHVMFIPLTEDRVKRFMDNGGFADKEIIDLREFEDSL